MDVQALPVPSDAPVTVSPRPSEKLLDKPFDPNPSREAIRCCVAYVLTGCIVVEILAMLIGFGIGRPDVGAIKEFATIVFTPTLTLFGAITGFYFGSKDS